MFDSMPKLLERSGTSSKGSITAFYTVLVDGDDLDEPVTDTVRGILDGHIVLSRAIAQRYHYPAIDVLASISRLAPNISGPVTDKAAGIIRRNMAVYAEAEDLINVGAYHSGSNPAIDEAIEKHEAIEKFLIQDVKEKSSIEETLTRMGEIAGIPIPEEERTEFLRKIILSSILQDSRKNDGYDDGDIIDTEALKQSHKKDLISPPSDKLGGGVKRAGGPERVYSSVTNISATEPGLPDLPDMSAFTTGNR
jgi:F0F1-type ATP synthase beta subunit